MTIYISFFRVNSADYFGITYLLQQLVYWKKIAVQAGISLKSFKILIKVYVRNFITGHTYSGVSQRGVQEISRFRYCSVFQFHFNYNIIQASQIKCHVLLFSSAITTNSEVVIRQLNFINHLFHHYGIWNVIQ